MSSKTIQKFETFLPSVVKEVDPSTIDRLVWYCNASGRLIPERLYNKSREIS